MLLVHGIRDFGKWQQMVTRALQSDSVTVIPIKYGYFDVFRFLAPFDTSRKPAERLKREFANAIRAYPNARISVIAHSFGTYLVTKILEDDPDLRFWRVIFCGSVVKQDFRWERFRSQIGDPSDSEKRKWIINECGSQDIWPVLGQSAGWGYGAAGTDGFATVLATDRWHTGGHGLYFKDQYFVEEYWKPFIHDGDIHDGKGEQRSDAPWWLKLVEFLPLRILPPALLIGAAYWAGAFFIKLWMFG